jgi:hypothetical protein
MRDHLRLFTALTIVSAVVAIRDAAASESGTSQLDQVVLGDAASEQSHHVTADHAETLKGAFDQAALRLLPLSPASFDGGWISFAMNVDPQEQNYVTVKLWGSDKGQGAGRLLLYANGLQVGYRHEGDYDVLNQCDEEGEAPGRFFYETVPLPISLTRGKTELTLKIAALGSMWPYGTNFAQYQKNLAEPSRGIYRVYTHVQPRFEPEAAEKQGHAPEAAVRPEPGEEVIAQSKQVVVDRLNHLLQQPISAERSGNQKDRAARLLLVSEAYERPWTPAYHDPRAIEQIVQDGDSMAGDFAAKAANYAAADWPGAGPLGEAVMRSAPDILKRLDETATIAGKPVQRRQAWADALRKSVDYWRTHRRSYTNQSMIVDWNIYTANRALQLIEPQRALPEAHVLHFLYEATGIEPWLGSDPSDDAGHVADTPEHGATKPFGDHYSLVTSKGLSRELGWVATYGETILHFTCNMAKLTGDQRLRQQLANLEHARMYFRYPGVDAEGFRCMKLVSEVDNRTAHYPLSGGAYTAPNIREEWWMDVPALLSDDPIAVGAAQQSIDDRQYFAYIAGRLKDPDTLGMMRNVDEYEKVKSLPPSSNRLPMTDGQPDFAFADEQDAIVAVKHGDTQLFINLYYRAERGVNGVARVFEQTPAMTRIATVRTAAEAVPGSGRTYTRPDWIDGSRGKGMPPPGQEVHQAWAGEVLPISARPTGADAPAYGDWGPFLGKAAFYQLRYGPYLILMNCSEDQDLAVQLPPEFASTRDLISGKPASELAADARLKPLSTIVLYLAQ